MALGEPLSMDDGATEGERRVPLLDARCQVRSKPICESGARYLRAASSAVVALARCAAPHTRNNSHFDTHTHIQRDPR